ncbi:MAG: hypothetical protein PHV74_00125 [Dehalococcoidia bacterium]|nr:hypothetical protein [Dehalococcoidia bacterium]
MTTLTLSKQRPRIWLNSVIAFFIVAVAAGFLWLLMESPSGHNILWSFGTGFGAAFVPFGLITAAIILAPPVFVARKLRPTDTHIFYPVFAFLWAVLSFLINCLLLIFLAGLAG